ncbi:uncharacterized protein LOC130623309 isoform X2 [Hydractinia symbiolongicarpus]|uniref:uncharacterized protein LOC130623309 isoform X2 n=1 Tax=Hydractinia symbiolongicarpus TaxID=13093 RepID=UPI00254F290D|nr:uncharacterized protein LOC130623309 isoform X2 [Hydractinia symbiolongicarpus]
MTVIKILVISTLLGVVQSIQECPMEIYHQKVDGKDICKVTCPECDPGNEPVTPCHDIVRTRTFQIGCKNCSAGRYKDKHGSHACQSCVEKCPEDHIPTSQCNATTPLRCECKPRFFFRVSTGDCVSCCEKLTLLDEIKKCKDVIETCHTGIKTTNNPHVSKLPSSPVNGTVIGVFWIAIGILILVIVLLVGIIGIVAYKKNVCRKKVTKLREEHELQSINTVNDGYAETLSGNDAAAPLLSLPVHTDGQLQIARQPSVSEDSTMQYQDSKVSQPDDDNLSCAGERRKDWGTDVLGSPSEDDLSVTHHDSTTSSIIVQAEITPGLKIPPRIPPSAFQFSAPITMNITNTSISPSEICTKDNIVNSGLNKLVDPDLNNEDSKLGVRKKQVEAKPSFYFCSQDIPENGDAPLTTAVVREVEKNDMFLPNKCHVSHEDG